MELNVVREVLALAKPVREALSSMPMVDRPIALAGFPAGACSAASLVLGAVLADAGISGFRYISGERGIEGTSSWTSHAWLRRGSLDVDITADQFPDAPSAVLVADPSGWHAQFRIESVHERSDFRQWSDMEVLFVAFAHVQRQLRIRSQ